MSVNLVRYISSAIFNYENQTRTLIYLVRYIKLWNINKNSILTAQKKQPRTNFELYQRNLIHLFRHIELCINIKKYV